MNLLANLAFAVQFLSLPLDTLLQLRFPKELVDVGGPIIHIGKDVLSGKAQ